MFSERAPTLLIFSHLMGPGARGTDGVLGDAALSEPLQDLGRVWSEDYWTQMKLFVANVTNTSRAPALRDVGIYDWADKGECL